MKSSEKEYLKINYPLFDDNKRVVCMTNTNTNGKNLLVSSNAYDFNCHQSPYDVASLLVFLTLNKNMALSCMKENGERFWGVENTENLLGISWRGRNMKSRKVRKTPITYMLMSQNWGKSKWYQKWCCRLNLRSWRKWGHFFEIWMKH